MDGTAHPGLPSRLAHPQEAPLASGGFGDVWRIIDKTTQQNFVVKFIKGSKVGRAAAVRRRADCLERKAAGQSGKLLTTEFAALTTQVVHMGAYYNAERAEQPIQEALVLLTGRDGSWHRLLCRAREVRARAQLALLLLH